MATETKNEVAVSTKPRTEIAEPRPSQMFGPLDEVERLLVIVQALGDEFSDMVYVFFVRM